MSPKKVSLSELKGEETKTAANSDKYTKVDISDIATVKKEDPRQQAVDELFQEIDAGILRTQKELTDNIIEPAKEHIYEQNLDDDAPIKVPTGKVVGKLSLDTEDDEDEKTTASPKEKPINPFTSTDDEDFKDEEDEDLDEEERIQKEKQEAAFKEFQTEVQSKIKQNRFDLSKFTVSSKPVSVSKLLASGNITKRISDWILYYSNKPIAISELSGAEIERLNPGQNRRSRLRSYQIMYHTIYSHLEDPNKPASLEAWVKTLNFFDINHLYFAIYKACFEGANYVPYTCMNKECGHVFMKNIDNIMDMVKFKSKDVENRVKAIFNKDITSPSIYEADVVAVSDTYAISFKPPSVYNVVFENSALDEEFTAKYSDVLGVISYIDNIFFIDKVNFKLIPIDLKPDANDFVKSTRRKVRIYHDILKTLNSDEYANLLLEMQKINDNGSDDIKYVTPACKCEKCGKDIPEQEKEPLDMLFTRHQLVAIANS